MNIWINTKSDIKPVIAGLVVYVLLSSLVNHVQAYENENRDKLLAEKFAPILVLTENPTPRGRGYAVINPEPVEIVGADSVSNVWVTAYDLGGTPHLSAPFSGAWNPSMPHAFMKSAFPKVDFSQNKFAFITADKSISYTGLLPGRAIPANYILRLRYFDYPGNGKETWENAYFPEEGQDDTYAGWRFPNTVYAHVFERNSADNYGSFVIKYYCFYPFNEWENNHEGDWTKINVMVTSLDPDEAEIYGVDYRFHGKGITYYNITDTPSATNNVRESIAPVGGRYPVVYVSAGGHGHFPTSGHYENGGQGLPIGTDRLDVDEDLTSYGLVLHPEIVDSDANKDIAQSYKIVLLPEPVDTLDNMGLAPEMSWLGADVQWGTPNVLSWPLDDHAAPLGPYNQSSWNRIHYDSEKPKNYPKSYIPYAAFHNFPIVGDVSWSGTISLLGDIVVFPGATLTIKPGTIIEFGAGVDSHKFPAQGHGEDGLAEIFVYGTLNAEGKSTNPIHFRKDSRPGHQGVNTWGGIRVMPGGSVDLNHTSIREMAPPPAPPTGLTAQVGNKGVTLAWVLPEVDDPTITGWTYRAGTISGADTTWADWQDISHAATTSHLVEALINGTAYTFQVAAVNPTGRGAESDPSAAVTAAGPPEPPELTVAAGHERVRVRWSPGADNGSKIEQHEWRYRAGTAAWNPDWTVYATGEQIVRNLDNDTTYTFQMKAKNKVGYSKVVAVQATPRHPIQGPTTLSVAENRDGSIASYRFAPAVLDQSLVDYRLKLSDIADSGLFALDRSGGLHFRDAPDFEAPTDGDGDGVYTVWIKAAPVSGDGPPVRREKPLLPFTKQVDVTVTDADDPGVIKLSSQSPQVGVPLTAALTDPDGGLTGVRWQWQAHAPDATEWQPLSSTSSAGAQSRFTPQAAQVGRALRAVVTGYGDRFGPGKSAQSEATLAVPSGVPDTPVLQAFGKNGEVRLNIKLVADNGSPITRTETRVYSVSQGDTT